MNKILSFSLFLACIFCLTSCAVAGGIFKAGVWVGILVVVAIIGLIIFFVSKGSNK